MVSIRMTEALQENSFSFLQIKLRFLLEFSSNFSQLEDNCYLPIIFKCNRPESVECRRLSHRFNELGSLVIGYSHSLWKLEFDYSVRLLES